LNKKIGVIGAGGKMGSGIALLVARPGRTVCLIDPDEGALVRLKKYLREQLKKEAEKAIIKLREVYQDKPHLVDNEDIVRHHVELCFESLFFSTALEEIQGADLVFEAAPEDIALKTDILKKVALLAPSALVLTNTSSIPISYLEEESGLEGRIAGFHFYNPPAVQRLVEIVSPNPNLLKPCEELARELGKTPVISKDVAGFIGNGVFIREVLFSLKLLDKMEMPLPEAIATLDLITRVFLFRPMGIFQLVHYVGIDVVANIFKVMRRFLDDPSFDPELLKKLQVPPAEPKDVSPSLELAPTWKELSKEKNPEERIADFYRTFMNERSLGLDIALKYLFFEKDVAFLLVKTGVAKSLHDVSEVLKLGFYHLYGPDSAFIPASCDRCIQ